MVISQRQQTSPPTPPRILITDPVDLDQIDPLRDQRVPDEVAELPRPARDAVVPRFEPALVRRPHLGPDQLDLLRGEAAAMGPADGLLEVGRGAVAVMRVVPV